MTLRLGIVLPTYNERGNLRGMVERLDAALTLDLRLEQTLAAHTAMFVALDNALDASIETGATADGAGVRR